MAINLIDRITPKNDAFTTLIYGNHVGGGDGHEVPLDSGGTGASLTDPNADRILFWDDSAGEIKWLTAGTNLTITDTTITAADDHAEVTLAASADAIMDLSTQEISLETQNANTVLAGPTTGEAAAPDFRSLVADDIPDISATYAAAGHNHDSDYVSVVAGGTEDNFTSLTAGGEVQDSGYAASNFATDDHTHDTITITADPSDHTATGIKIALTAGENLVYGNVCYIDVSDGKAHKADASALDNSSRGFFLCLESVSEDSSGSFLTYGVTEDSHFSFDMGKFVYLSPTTAGLLTKTIPTATNQVIMIMGIAIATTRLLFNPQLIQVVHT